MPQFMKVLYRVQIIKPNQVKCFGDQSTQGNHYQFTGEIQQTKTMCDVDSRTKLSQNDGPKWWKALCKPCSTNSSTSFW